MKQEVRRFRASAPGDRVALIAFAGRSYILSPLTSDDGALELFLENLDPTIVGQVGSALAPPLKQGIDLLSVSQGGADRALVVMSDGEAFDDRAAALTLARGGVEQRLRLLPRHLSLRLWARRLVLLLRRLRTAPASPALRRAQCEFVVPLCVAVAGRPARGGSIATRTTGCERSVRSSSRQQAEALLDAAAREERETQSRRQRGSRGPRAPGEKDW